MVSTIGQAYGFFDCNATKEEIKAEIPEIRKASKTPDELELILTKDIDSLNVDSDLLPIAQELDPKYVIEANYPGATNKQTADELADILNQAYQSQLYEKNEKFKGEIIYKVNGEYIFRK